MTTLVAERNQEIDAILDDLVVLIDGANIVPRTNSYLDIVILSILSKAIALGRAVCKLVAGGFAEEAFGLTRTLIELSFTIRWIANHDSHNRAKQFVEYFQKDREGWFEKLQPKYFSDLEQSMDKSEREKMLAIARNYRSPHDWTGLPDKTRGMALEPDAFEIDASGRPYKAEFDYEVMYKATSHFVHGTIIGVAAHLLPTGKPAILRKDYGTDEIRAGLALHHVVVYTNKIIISAFRSLGLKLPESLSERFDNAALTVDGG